MEHSAIYVSGGMTGLPEHNFPAFNRAAAALRAARYEVVNPAEMDAAGGTESFEWADFLRRDISVMMAKCDKIAHIDGWRASKGARLEHYIAEDLGWEIKTVDEWLMKASVRLAYQ